MSDPSPSFFDRLIGSRGNLVHRIRAKDLNGRWAIYFVLVRESREAAFLADVAGDSTLDFEAYGDVLASNFGDEPTAEVRAMLKSRFGFDI